MMSVPFFASYLLSIHESFRVDYLSTGTGFVS